MNDPFRFGGVQEEEGARDLSNNSGTDLPSQESCGVSAEETILKGPIRQVFIDKG